jgi:Fis family transcriptional regulator
MQLVEKPLLEITLTHTRGNQTKAAEILGLNRGTLRTKLKAHGIIVSEK